MTLAIQTLTIFHLKHVFIHSTPSFLVGVRKFSSGTVIMYNLREKFSSKCFGGYQKIFAHDSKITNCEMRFAIYLPSQSKCSKLPVIYFLSGLGMDHVDFINKSGCERYASEQGVIIVAPDSSPRNTGIPGEKSRWNIGTKASYYIDCTQEPWSKHFKMYSYLCKELPEVIKENFPVLPKKQSIIGFSIGGYGAFLLAMKNPNLFASISALAPVCDATLAKHSQEGLELYLGEKQNWDSWSSIKTAEKYDGPKIEFLIDQGTSDEYLLEHLFQKEFIKACESSGISVQYYLREGYIHDYFFIKTFLEDHIKYHMQFLTL